MTNPLDYLRRAVARYLLTEAGLRIPVGDFTDGQYLKYTGGKLQSAAVSGGGPSYQWSPLRDWIIPATNGPAYEDHPLATYGRQTRFLFDDTTEEHLQGHIYAPDDLAATGNPILRVWGSPVAGAASKNIAIKFYFHAVNDGETLDGAYGSITSSDLAVAATTDYVNVFDIALTRATFAVVAMDMVRYKLARVAPSANNLTGDWALYGAGIGWPL